MRDLEWWLIGKYAVAKNSVKNFFEKENGESNIIAIILVILVVIALASVFKDAITDLVEKLFDAISPDDVANELSGGLSKKAGN